MYMFSLSEMIEITGASLIGTHTRTGIDRITGAAVDSRKVKKGSLFVALKGDRTDGHLYLPDALSKGAAAVMISEDFQKADQFQTVRKELDIPVLVHENPLDGLQKLAAAWVRKFPDLIRIGITGSNGKTTTKEILAAILSEIAPTVKNRGNLNSEIGLPLAVLEIREEHRFGVFEMGVNHPGEMEQMVRVFDPQYGLITNVGTAHIGLLGSREGIAREKGTLFASLPANGIAFCPENFEWLDLYREMCRASFVSFGPESTLGMERIENRGLKGWELSYRGAEFHLPLPGSHNLQNALAAIQAARSLGARTQHIRAGIEKMELLDGRSQIIDGPVTILHDGYNANAESVLAIFSTLKECVSSEQLVLVLGSMKELGDAAEVSHRMVGRGIAGLSPRLALLFGEEMNYAGREAKLNGYRGDIRHTDDFQQLRDMLCGSIHPGDVVLLKGSRSMELERLIPVLQHDCSEKAV